MDKGCQGELLSRVAIVVSFGEAVMTAAGKRAILGVNQMGINTNPREGNWEKWLREKDRLRVREM